jgi:hypothetical protein
MVSARLGVIPSNFKLSTVDKLLVFLVFVDSYGVISLCPSQMSQVKLQMIVIHSGGTWVRRHNSIYNS